jgi:hypothetical protein
MPPRVHADGDASCIGGAAVLALTQPRLYRAAPIPDQRTKKLERRSEILVTADFNPLHANAEPFGKRCSV